MPDTDASKLDEWRATLIELADDMEAEITARYGEFPHPSQQHKFNRDMEPVRRARRLVREDVRPPAEPTQLNTEDACPHCRGFGFVTAVGASDLARAANPEQVYPYRVACGNCQGTGRKVRPPAEPDEDLIDLRAIFSAWDPEALLIMETAEKDFALAKAALIAIKARVRDEEIRDFEARRGIGRALRSYRAQRPGDGW